jgi:hypothetical protein
MLTEIMSFPVRNGNLLETYSLERDADGDIFLRNVLDANAGAPHDMMHIDPQAFEPLARAFAALERRRTQGMPMPVVVQFPTRVVDFVGRVR